MPADRDVAAFDGRAATYEQGMLGRLHREIAKRTVDVILASGSEPVRILDIGCGTGYLLRVLADHCPLAQELAGIDPSPSMIRTAESLSADDRLWFGSGIGAENLPFGEDAFDVITATTSFDHWSNQRAGLAECARVSTPIGRLIVVDQFSGWLLPTLVAGRRGEARTKASATRLLKSVGFASIRWQGLYTPLIKAVVASR